MEAILVPADSSKIVGSCLKNYLENDRKKTKSLLPGPVAEKDSLVFEKNVFNITHRLDEFLESDKK